MGRLQGLQGTKHPVVFGIRNFRRVQGVVSPAMVVQSRSQLLGLRKDVHIPLGRVVKQVRRAHAGRSLVQENKRRACGEPADNSRASKAL
jgi:hypothetical protein